MESCTGLFCSEKGMHDTFCKSSRAPGWKDRSLLWRRTSTHRLGRRIAPCAGLLAEAIVMGTTSVDDAGSSVHAVTFTVAPKLWAIGVPVADV